MLSHPPKDPSHYHYPDNERDQRSAATKPPQLKQYYDVGSLLSDFLRLPSKQRIHHSYFYRIRPGHTPISPGFGYGQQTYPMANKGENQTIEDGPIPTRDHLVSRKDRLAYLPSRCNPTLPRYER